MTAKSQSILVFGATGQQGGAAARAILSNGLQVRALVRDPSSVKARALSRSGVEVVSGNFRDRASVEAAMHGMHGVFSVQPGSGQPAYGLSDDDEVRAGMLIADIAEAFRVRHFVYSSAMGAEPNTGLGHIDAKWRVEQHLRQLNLNVTILRPANFMENLLWPQCGLASGSLTYLAQAERPLQFIATDDIGNFAVLALLDPQGHVGSTIELAGDALSGNEVAAEIGRAIGKPVSYARFPRDNEFIAHIIDAIDAMSPGNADIPALRERYPALLTLRMWLARSGAAAIKKMVEENTPA